MSVEAGIYAAFSTALAGLVANPATSGKVEHVLREHTSGGRTLPTPYLFVEVVGDQHAAAFSTNHYAGLVRVHLFYNRDEDSSQAGSDAIIAAVRTALENISPADGSGWSYSKVTRLRGFRGPSTETQGHRIEEYAVIINASGGDS